MPDLLEPDLIIVLMGGGCTAAMSTSHGDPDLTMEVFVLDPDDRR